MPSLPTSNLPHRPSLRRLVDQSTLLLMLAIGSLILLLALLILFYENTNATRGYRLRSLQRERSQLLLELEVVNMHIAEVQALENIQNDKRIQTMLPPKKVQYYKEP